MTTHTDDGITLDITDTGATLTIDGQFAARSGPNWKHRATEGDRVWHAVALMQSIAYSYRPDPQHLNVELVRASRERLNAFADKIRGYHSVRSATSAVDVLTAEGHETADVLAAIDSLIDSGLTIAELTATDEAWITDVELQVLRDQLDGGQR